MGQHRGEGGIRGISKGPVIVVGLVVLLVLAVIGWFQLRERIDSQGEQAAGACVEGDAVLHVTADPDIAPTVDELAAAYTDTEPVVRDHCVRVEVTSKATGAVGAALSGDPAAPWDENGLGPRPDLWIPDSSAALEQLGRPGVVSGEPRSVASSPVVLAVPRDVSAALSAAPTGWQDLPALQSTPTSLQDRGLPGWGNLRLALPIGADSSATGMAVHAVAAAVAGGEPLTAEQLSTGPVRAAVTQLSRDAPPRPSSDSTTSDAVAEMIEEADEADAKIHAVPSTEQQVFATLRENPRARITAFAPSGPTPVADHPAAIIDGTDETRARAASELVEFLRSPQQGQSFADAGFQVAGASAPADSPIDVTEVETPLAPSDAATAAALNQIVESPVPDRATTVLLDESRSMGATEGSGTRLANTASAIGRHIESMSDSSNFGLWVYSQNLDGSAPYRTVVPTGPLSDGDRRQKLTDELADVEAGTGSWTYASLAAAYEDAVTNYVPGRTNSVLLINDGADDQPNSTRAELLAAIAEASDSNAPVQIDVISIGDNPAESTLQAASDRTGGTLITVDSTDGPALDEAIERLTTQ